MSYFLHLGLTDKLASELGQKSGKGYTTWKKVREGKTKHTFPALQSGADFPEET